MLLLGYSHGGLVAQAYASAYPERVDRLILAATLARFGPEQEAATQAAKEKRSGHPWFEEANAAGEEDSDSATDEKVRDQTFRGMPFTLGKVGRESVAYLDTCRSEPDHV